MKKGILILNAHHGTDNLREVECDVTLYQPKTVANNMDHVTVYKHPDWFATLAQYHLDLVSQSQRTLRELLQN